MYKVLYVSSKWPYKSNSNDGGDSTINEIIRAVSPVCTLDLLCFRDDINYEEKIDGLNKIFIIGLDFANFETYSNRDGSKFYKRIQQAKIAAHEIRKLADDYQIIIVQHTSFILYLKDDIDILQKIVLLPMFTTASYVKAGDFVPKEYKLLEEQTIG